ncbi:MAG: PH domain-containing protein [Sphingomonadales bacterium]|nr:PH domain-containing protein [Sphingomonadales bacterium]NCQ21866.1 PH domain-containing protein [Sphingomonadales bacterium]NCT03262.1 PH domain-containing protein [Sphingomonadales bacterium]
MDLNYSQDAAATDMSLTAGIDHAALENDGPKAFGDRMGTPAAREKVLWKGRPELRLLARTAFHTRKAGIYMAGLSVVALLLGNTTAALVAAGLGVVLVGLLYVLAWASARSTLYILTDERLIMRIGMAIETRVNVPLKQIKAASFRPRDNDHGDIAFELNGERLLSTLLLWPHVRPGHYAMPQPMLRAVPEAARLAEMIGEARAQFGAIDRNLTDIKEAAPAIVQHAGQAAHVTGRPATAPHRPGQVLEGAPA